MTQRQQRQRRRVTRLCRGNMCSSSLPLPRRKSVSFQTKGECHKVRHHILRFQWFQWQAPTFRAHMAAHLLCRVGQLTVVKDLVPRTVVVHDHLAGTNGERTDVSPQKKHTGNLPGGQQNSSQMQLWGLSSGLPTWESNEKRRQLITWKIHENPIHF